MKRCPECGREYDNTMMFCLDDGAELLYGPASKDEPATVILSIPGAVGTGDLASEPATRAQIHMTEKTAVLPTGTGDVVPKPRELDKRLLAAPILLAIIVLAGLFGYRYVKSGVAEQINSIAVLPFENRSGSADTDYLSDGLADSLIYRLSQLPNLKVSPTSSVMRYKGRETDIVRIAGELKVDAVMSGRLVQRGDDLSISVQLIDARNEKVIWAEQYDRKMADLLATQREITTAITQKLQLKLSGNDTGITKKYTTSNEAYQLYLKGRYHFARRNRDDMEKAIAAYKEAINIDPQFALAYARIAEAYNQMSNYPYLSPDDAFPQAKLAAQRALEIDPSLSEGHAALGNTLTSYDWDWPGAERSFKRAIELDPNSVAAHYRYGFEYLASVGRTDEALAEVQRGMEMEPLDPNMSANLGRMYLYARQPKAALDAARKAFDTDPEFVLGRFLLGLDLNANGRYDEAIALCEKQLETEPNTQRLLLVVGYAHARLGHRREADAVIARLAELSKTEYVIASWVAAIYGAMGEKDKAFAQLDKAVNVHDSWAKWAKVEPLFDPLRDDPRFQVILRRMNLPE